MPPRPPRNQPGLAGLLLIKPYLLQYNGAHIADKKLLFFGGAHATARQDKGDDDSLSTDLVYVDMDANARRDAGTCRYWPLIR